jgi:hypothetical protein
MEEVKDNRGIQKVGIVPPKCWLFSPLSNLTIVLEKAKSPLELERWCEIVSLESQFPKLIAGAGS